MKKFVLYIILLPNLFFANNYSSIKNLEMIVVENTKTLLFESFEKSSDFSIRIFHLIGRKKNKVNLRFNKKTKTLNLEETPFGSYIISTHSEKQYVDYLVIVEPNGIEIVDVKKVQSPIINYLGKKMSISLFSDQSEVLVRFKNSKNETILSEYYSSDELNNKVFNLEDRYGIIMTSIEYDEKIFKDKIVLSKS